VHRVVCFRQLAPLLLLACGAVASAHAEPATGTVLPAELSLDEAIALFRAHGFDLLIADAGVRGAEGDLHTAGAVPNPTWSLQGSYSFAFPGGDKPQTPWGVTAGLGDNNAIEDAISGKRGLRRAVARAALAAARFQRADVARTVEFQVKSQYLSALLARDLLDFAVETQRGALKTYELMHVRYLSGAISEADEARIETAKLEADQSVDQAEATLRTAKLGLAFLLGVRGRVPEFRVSADLPVYRVPPALAARSKEDLIDDALGRRPDLAGARKQRDRADAQLRLARRLRVPDLSLDVAYQQQAGTDRNAAQPPTFSLGVGGTLPIFYLQRGEVMRAAADLRVQSLTGEKLAAQITSDVETAWTHYAGSRKLVERMQTRLLDRARRARDLVEIQYKKGAASLLELLDAQRVWIATNGEYYQDLASYWTAVFELEQAVGMELR